MQGSRSTDVHLCQEGVATEDRADALIDFKLEGKMRNRCFFGFSREFGLEQGYLRLPFEFAFLVA
jgi:hypothetical protein